MDRLEDGIFPHKCEMPTCVHVVQYDDEPYCFKHSPDSGSSEYGYSARRKAEREKQFSQPWPDTENDPF